MCKAKVFQIAIDILPCPYKDIRIKIEPPTDFIHKANMLITYPKYDTIYPGMTDWIIIITEIIDIRMNDVKIIRSYDDRKD